MRAAIVVQRLSIRLRSWRPTLQSDGLFPFLSLEEAQNDWFPLKNEWIRSFSAGGKSHIMGKQGSKELSILVWPLLSPIFYFSYFNVRLQMTRQGLFPIYFWHVRASLQNVRVLKNSNHLILKKRKKTDGESWNQTHVLILGKRRSNHLTMPPYPLTRSQCPLLFSYVVIPTVFDFNLWRHVHSTWCTFPAITLI